MSARRIFVECVIVLAALLVASTLVGLLHSSVLSGIDFVVSFLVGMRMSGRWYRRDR